MKTLRLVDMVSAKWKNFGVLLGITQNQLDVWEKQYCGNANMCWTKVMAYWLNGGSKDQYPPTWDGLYTLLEDAEYSQVAEELKKVVGKAIAKESSIAADTTCSSEDHHSSVNETVCRNACELSDYCSDYDLVCFSSINVGSTCSTSKYVSDMTDISSK